MGTSICVAAYMDDLMREVDQAIYRAKREKFPV
jgi:hypothetical protein